MPPARAADTAVAGLLLLGAGLIWLGHHIRKDPH